MSNRTKDRDIPITEFLNNLQKEYLVNEFRRKIYVSPADKRYHKKVMDYKKEKIEDISNRNSLPNIFNSVDVKKKIYYELFNELNQPIFHMNEKDIEFYYLVDSEVIVHSKKVLSRIKSVNLDKKEIIVFSEGKNLTVELADISRVL